MVHLKTLGIKAIVIGITVFSLFGIFYDANLTNLFWVSVLTTGISFVIGDLLILRRFGNVAASILDFPLAFLLLWLLSGMFLEVSIPIISISLMGAFFITCCEPFVHTYLVENLEEEKTEKQEHLRRTGRLQTEFTEEFKPKVSKHNKRNRPK